MLMSLGLFVFDMGTLPFDELQRRSDWRHPTVDRVGARSASQYTGPGEDLVTISGTLCPEVAGSYSAIETIRTMAGTGESWPLVDGTGAVLGTYLILALDERKSHFIDNGIARMTEFALDLRRVD